MLCKVNNWGHVRFGSFQIYLSETMASTYLEIPVSNNDTFYFCFHNSRIAEIDATTAIRLNRNIKKLHPRSFPMCYLCYPRQYGRPCIPPEFPSLAGSRYIFNKVNVKSRLKAEPGFLLLFCHFAASFEGFSRISFIYFRIKEVNHLASLAAASSFFVFLIVPPGARAN